jgi:hypothetical protein
MPTNEAIIPATNVEISRLYHGLSTYSYTNLLPSIQPNCYDYDVPAIAASNDSQLVKRLTTINSHISETGQGTYYIQRKTELI